MLMVTAIGADCWPTGVVPGKAVTVWADNTLQPEKNRDASAVQIERRFSRITKEWSTTSLSAEDALNFRTKRQPIAINVAGR
jgi:hypothetical protein